MTTTPAPTALKKEPTKDPAKEKEPKVAKVKKEGAAARPRLPKFPDEHVITVFKENSKARGAAERFKKYQTGMTIKAYVDKIETEFNRTSGQTMADIRWDIDHGFIGVGASVLPIPTPPPPQPKAEAQPHAAP